MEGYNKINKELYNPHLTYEQNIQNGVNLPPIYGQPVLIYDSDSPRYLVGRIGIEFSRIDKFTFERNRLVVYDSIHGDVYSGVDYIYWKEFEFFEEETDTKVESDPCFGYPSSADCFGI